MLNQPTSTPRQLGRYLLAAPLLVAVALGYSGARAQTAPVAPTTASTGPGWPTNAAYYLDGKPSSQEVMQQLDPKTIASIDVLKDREILQRGFHTTAPGVVVVTTIANADAPAVRELASRVDLASSYARTPAQVNAVVPKALAYITSHYPDARLSGEVTEMKQKTTGEVKYQVQLVTGKRPFYVYFSPQGDFLSQ